MCNSFQIAQNAYDFDIVIVEQALVDTELVDAWLHVRLRPWVKEL